MMYLHSVCFVCVGRTALHWAVVAGRTSSVKILLKHSSTATLSSHDEQGFTPLLYVAVTGACDIAAALLKVRYQNEYPL